VNPAFGLLYIQKLLGLERSPELGETLRRQGMTIVRSGSVFGLNPGRTMEDRLCRTEQLDSRGSNRNDSFRQYAEPVIHSHANERLGLHEDRPNSWGMCLSFTMELEAYHRMPCCGHWLRVQCCLNCLRWVGEASRLHTSPSTLPSPLRISTIHCCYCPSPNYSAP